MINPLPLFLLCENSKVRQTEKIRGGSQNFSNKRYGKENNLESHNRLVQVG